MSSPQPRTLSFSELVGLAAGVMALNALAIDIMLPALGLIGEALNTPRDNDRQLVVVVYLLGNGVAHLFFGPLVDRYGRRNVLIISLGAYCAGSALCVIAPSFGLLLAARTFQGVATAAARVAMMASIRDQVEGRRMAELMSLALTILMAAPVIAPGLGQIILAVASWRWIFGALLIYGIVLGVWSALRLPETLARENATRLAIGPIVSAYVEFLRHRVSLGYTMISALSFGALFGFISSSEQLFVETFEIGEYFAVAFAAIAGSVAAATLINARLVNRFGMRRLTHGALILFFAVNLAHLCSTLIFGEIMLAFFGFMCAAFFTLGLIGPNCTALAMQPMGHIAGAAAAANGFAGTTLAGVIGGMIGAAYDGTSLPLSICWVLAGAAALGVAFYTEKGRLFEAGEQYEADEPINADDQAKEPA